MKYIIIIIVVAIAYNLFSLSSENENKPTTQKQTTITKNEFGNEWPLSINSGVVKCLPIGNGSVVFEAEGKTYAINGTAKGFAKKHNFYSIEDIWLDDPKFLEMAKEIAKAENEPLAEVLKSMGSPTKINISPVIDSGLKLCK
jgi:hypothetical protein